MASNGTHLVEALIDGKWHKVPNPLKGVKAKGDFFDRAESAGFDQHWKIVVPSKQGEIVVMEKTSAANDVGTNIRYAVVMGTDEWSERLFHSFAKTHGDMCTIVEQYLRIATSSVEVKPISEVQSL